MHTLDQVARTVEYIFDGQEIHKQEFPLFLETNRDRTSRRVREHLICRSIARRTGPEYCTRKILRQVHANKVKAAMAAGETIPKEVLEFHQYTPGLFNDVKKYSTQRGISLEY